MYSPGPAIDHFQQVEAEGAVFWLPLLLFIGICESYRVGLGWAEPRSERFYSLRDDYEPGNLGFDPFGLLPEDPKERYELQVGEGIYTLLVIILVLTAISSSRRQRWVLLRQL